MPTQRLTVVTIGGKASRVIARAIDAGRAASEDRDRSNQAMAAVDALSAAIRARATALPVIYFAEWIDGWSSGDLVPRALSGRLFEMACLSAAEASTWPDRPSFQFPEQRWFAARLNEAVETSSLADESVIVVLREVLGSLRTDQEIFASFDSVPDWLQPLADPISEAHPQLRRER